MLRTMLSSLFKELKKDLRENIRSYIFDAIRPLLKKVILAIIGASLVAIGVVFACVSLVKFLTIYVSAWMAWGLVGLTILIMGSLMSLVALRR